MIRPCLQDDAFLNDVESTAGSGVHVWWLGQSGYLVVSGPWRILIDPYLSDSLTRKYHGTAKPHVRMSDRVVDPAALREIAFVTSSHAHTDHLDAETYAALRKSNSPTLVAPRAERALVAQRWGPDENPIIFMNEGESQSLGDFQIRAVPAAHDQVERDAEGNCRYLGYVFRFGDFDIYHSGDTVVFPELVEHLRPCNIALAILPINGKVGNMNGMDAARLARNMNAGLVIPCHYDMFEFNTADPNDQFVPECQRLGQPYRVLQLGERFSSTEIPR